MIVLLVAAATATAFSGFADNIETRKEEARQMVFRIVNLTEQTVDPAEWGKNFPRQYDGYKRDRGAHRHQIWRAAVRIRWRSTSSRRIPRLKTIFAGYAFSVDYRARRGHAYMLTDQRETKRVQLPFRQTGSCLQCHASNVVAYRKKGMRRGRAGHS